MSGLLVGYLTFLELEKKRFNIVMFYILRYIRFVFSSGIFTTEYN